MVYLNEVSKHWIHTTEFPFFNFLFCLLRKELLWPELDNLLRDEDDVSGATTPYTATIPEYRVVFLKPDEDAHLDKSWSLANGHAVHDIHHPCR